MAKAVLDFEKPLVELEAKLGEMRQFAVQNGNAKSHVGEEISEEIAVLEQKVQSLRLSIYKNLTRWQRVQLARHPERPYTQDYIYMMTDDFTELSGDRYFGDDKAIVAGFAKLSDGQGFSQNVAIIGHQKGRDTKSNLYRNFGMAQPEGYRKALRIMKLAEKFKKPVITLIDTPGAFPGIEAEERGQAEAIARNLFEMARLKVPIICVVIGEGASGGAIGIAIGNRVMMMENAWYSVISPESCSSILWRSWNFKEQAAEALKLTAPDLMAQGIIDRIVPEPVGGAHREPEVAAKNLKDVLVEELKTLLKKTSDELIDERIEKFAKMGVVRE
jgi:acetyl-CoA carboxylase carboxyl transferase subunit alpha